MDCRAAAYDGYRNALSQTERRESKTVNGKTTTHRWDGDNIVSEDGENGAVYYRGINLIAQKDKAGINYYLYNAHGDITGLDGAGARMLSRVEYDAFGGPSKVSGVVFGYNGQYTDRETNLIYLRNRYYDPEIGRFTQEDPIKDGTNWYVYCGSNPINFVDPWGLLKEGRPRRDQTENVEGTFVTKITADKIKIENEKLIAVGNKCNWDSDNIELQQTTQEVNERIAKLISEDNAAIVYNVPIWRQGVNDCWLCVEMMVYMNDHDIIEINESNSEELNSYYASTAKSLSGNTNSNGSLKTNRNEPMSDDKGKKYLINNIKYDPIKVKFGGKSISDMSHDMLVVGVMELDGETYIKYNNSYNETTSEWVTYNEFKEINGQTFVGVYQ